MGTFVNSTVLFNSAAGGTTCWLGSLRHGGLSFVEVSAVCGGRGGVGPRDGGAYALHLVAVVSSVSH